MKKIAVVGNIDHGKTTLVSAISRAFDGEKRNLSDDPFIILRTEAEIEFGGEKYLFFDYPEDSGYEENLDGTEDGAILVVAATEGPMYGTGKALELCQKNGIEKMVVFVSMCDWVDDEDLIDFIEMDVQDELEKHGMDPDIPFIRGSAKNTELGYSSWADGVKKLVEAVADMI